jgi:hypothetical protein
VSAGAELFVTPRWSLGGELAGRSRIYAGSSRLQYSW